jgi:enoyl-[acyl-carrier protein] reductase I
VQIDALFGSLREHWDGLDGLVHAIAYAPREAISGELLDGLSRDAFREAHDISAYSFPALAKAALPMMEGRRAALLTMSYLGAVRVVPHYNTMGLAKASLEAAVRYLAANLGPRGIRVNGISAGPIKTLAASGIAGFGKILKFVETHAPLRRNVTIDDVGNAAAFLLSDLAAGVTGEVMYVDAGFNQVVGGMGDAGADA